MKPFREILSEKAPEKKYKSPQQLNVNIGGAPSSTSTPSTGRIIKKNVSGTRTSTSSGSTAAEVSARAQRFSQSFGTPTGADPRTGAPTYRPPAELTNLPSSRTGATPSPEAYSRVKPGDLEIKRQARTAEVPGKPGVRSATPQGVQNFLLNRETGGMSRRSIPAEQGRAAQQRVAQSMQNPNVVADVSARINQEVGGRRAETSTPAEPFSVSEKDKKILQRMARPTTSIPSAQSLTRQLGTGAGRRAAAASQAAKDIADFEKQRGFHQRVLQAVKDLPPETPVKPKPTPEVVKPKPIPATPAAVKPEVVKPKPIPATPAAVKPAAPVKPSSVTLSLTKPDVPKVSKGPSLSVSTPRPTTTAANIEKVGKSLLKQMRADKTAEKAAKAVATAKAWKAAGGLASGVAAAYDAKTGYERAKAAGASERRALGSGAARAVGGLLGGAVGSTVGSVAGLPGAIVGGTAGYTAGSELASRAYNKVTGPLGKKLTTQGVLTNIRTAVPKEVRAQIPTNIRKGFTKFVTDAGRSYGNWSRSQEAKK